MSRQIDELTKIADAIRSQEGSEEPIVAKTYADRISRLMNMPVDEVPVVGSSNLVKSGGVYDALHDISADSVSFSDGETFQQKLDSGELKGEDGAQGQNGKSAYEAAQDGGYDKNEAQFNLDLAKVSEKVNEEDMEEELASIKPKSKLMTINASYWNGSGPYTVTMLTSMGILADESKQLIIPTPRASDQSTYMDCGIRVTKQEEGALTFTAKVKPSSDIGVYITIIPLENI